MKSYWKYLREKSVDVKKSMFRFAWNGIADDDDDEFSSVWVKLIKNECTSCWASQTRLSIINNLFVRLTFIRVVFTFHLFSCIEREWEIDECVYTDAHTHCKMQRNIYSFFSVLNHLIRLSITICCCCFMETTRIQKFLVITSHCLSILYTADKCFNSSQSESGRWNKSTKIRDSCNVRDKEYRNENVKLRVQKIFQPFFVFSSIAGTVLFHWFYVRTKRITWWNQHIPQLRRVKESERTNQKLKSWLQETNDFILDKIDDIA